MAFERAKIVVKAASVGTGIKVSLAKFRGNTAKMKFSITKAAAKDLGWSTGDKLEVLIGTGEHHGIIRVRKNNSVGEAEIVSRKAMKGDYFQISLGHQQMFVDRAEVARWCQFEKIEDGYVEIILPKWADETAPKKAAAAPQALPTGTQPIRKPASVTANLMGDPPAGRRQMLEKVGSL